MHERKTIGKDNPGCVRRRIMEAYAAARREGVSPNDKTCLKGINYKMHMKAAQISIGLQTQFEFDTDDIPSTVLVKYHEIEDARIKYLVAIKMRDAIKTGSNPITLEPFRPRNSITMDIMNQIIDVCTYGKIQKRKPIGALFKLVPEEESALKEVFDVAKKAYPEHMHPTLDRLQNKIILFGHRDKHFVSVKTKADRMEEMFLDS